MWWLKWSSRVSYLWYDPSHSPFCPTAVLHNRTSVVCHFHDYLANAFLPFPFGLFLPPIMHSRENQLLCCEERVGHTERDKGLWTATSEGQRLMWDSEERESRGRSSLLAKLQMIDHQPILHLSCNPFQATSRFPICRQWEIINVCWFKPQPF